jgi:hypothetical protein
VGWVGVVVEIGKVCCGLSRGFYVGE